MLATVGLRLNNKRLGKALQTIELGTSALCAHQADYVKRKVRFVTKSGQEFMDVARNLKDAYVTPV